MAQYKLTYFDFSRSRGEECRLALFIAGVDFVDRRIAREEWPSLKTQTPYGSIPTLEVEGKSALAQSNAILGYVGQRYGLLPRDPWQAAQHVAILDSVEELRSRLAPSGNLTDPAAKKQAREEFASGPLREWATAVERQVQGPFVAGSAISVADIKIQSIMSSFKSGVIDHVPTDAFASFTKLEALYGAVLAHPKVAEWKSRHA
jgi:prostaglandin-H2 D-isomerase / glutathione transferase